MAAENARDLLLQRSHVTTIFPVSDIVIRVAACGHPGVGTRLTTDLGNALRAGVISLPDWFDRFASLGAIAAGGREEV